MTTSPPQRVSGFAKNRLEALIDGIFAVALTLLVLDIKLPENVSYASNDQLWMRLLSLERHFAIYAISFIVIGMYWIGHHVQFHFVRYTDRRLIMMNLVYLLLISFVPFATDLVGEHENLILPSEIYGVTLLALSAMAYVHLNYLFRHPYLSSPTLTAEVVALIKRRILMFTLIPVLSMLVAFYSTHLSLYCYVLLVLAHFSAGRLDEHIHTTPSEIPD